jgi:hypothetical protein
MRPAPWWLNMTERLAAEVDRTGDNVQAKDIALAHSVRRGMLLGAALTVALIVYGVIRFPTVWSASAGDRWGIVAGIGIATTYGIVGWFAVRARGFGNPRVLRHGVRFGLYAGAVFAVSMLGEYLVPHGERENVMLALATFGLFFLLLFVAGFAAAFETNRLTAAPLAAVWAALIASQLWFILLLAIYYAFVGTPQEARFLEVDQVIADFRRSGMADLRAFIFGDYMGGGFFHSLLAPLLAVPLGFLGGLVATLLRFTANARHRSRPRHVD